MNKYYQAIALFKRRDLNKCLDLCNEIFQEKSNPKFVIDGLWQLKIMCLTQRVYIHNSDDNENNSETEEIEIKSLETAVRPGTLLETPFRSRLGSSLSKITGSKSMTSARPVTGMAHPYTSTNRPGSSIGTRPATRCSTVRQLRIVSATAYNLGDRTAALFQASRMNPTIYAERPSVVKPLFKFLLYHENDAKKAYSLCEALIDYVKEKTDWWWEQQRGRCLLTLNYPKKAEQYLKHSLSLYPHPDTYALMCSMYLKLKEPQIALQLIDSALDRMPYEIILRSQKARIYKQLNQMPETMQTYCQIIKLSPINTEALACIAVNYFYHNQPEVALMYYRRILSMGAHSAELYCNLGLCCLYSGKIDLVFPCFKRSINLSRSQEQRSVIWYNMSFIAIVSIIFTSVHFAI